MQPHATLLNTYIQLGACGLSMIGGLLHICLQYCMLKLSCVSWMSFTELNTLVLCLVQSCRRLHIPFIVNVVFDSVVPLTSYQDALTN